MLGFGFASGLPLPLSTFTLHQWLAVAGISVQTIGLSAVVALPYTLKFLWSPLFDAGSRQRWLLRVQPALAGAILLLAATDPQRNVTLTMLAALLVALASASQDIVIDAWRINTFTEAEQGAALAAYIWGYRTAMAVASPGVIWLSGRIGWHAAIGAMAVLLLAAMAITLLAPEPVHAAAPRRAAGLAAFRAAILDPLRDFLARNGAAWLLAFVILFRLGKVFADQMAAPFYRYALHFSSDAVAAANFLPNLLGTFAGAAFGGLLVAKLGARRAVLAAGALQAVSLALYILLAQHPSTAMLSAKVAGEYFAGAAADTAFLAYVSTLCSRQYTASQYALLSSLAALVFHTLGGAAGYAAEALGWVPFFAACILAALPALAILLKLRERPLVTI